LTLSRFVFFPKFSSLPSRLFLFVARILLFYGFLKWGEALELPRCSAQPAHIFICWPHTELLFLTHNLTSKSRFNKKRSGYHDLSFLVIFFIRRSNSELHFRGAHETLFIFKNILPSPSFYRRCFIFEPHAHAGLNHAANFCLQE